jgi:hypothetical protein
MQFGGPPIPGVIYNTTLSRPDSALALALLYGLEGKRESRIASIAITENGLGAAAFADAVSRVYQLGPPPNTNRTLPIGLAADKPLPQDNAFVKVALERVDENGKPAHRRNVHRVSDTAEVTALMRNSLTYFQDGMVSVILSAPATYLSRALDYPGTIDLVKAKVRTLVVTEGNQDAAALRRVLADWPSPVVFVGRDIGENLKFPGASVATDFDWAKAHPVVDYYSAAKAESMELPVQDLVAALYAVRPQSDLFQLSEPGSIEIADTGQMLFTPGAPGKQKRLVVDASKKDAVLAAIHDVLHTKPVPPPARRRFSPEELEKLRKERELELQKREAEAKKETAAPITPPTAP